MYDTLLMKIHYKHHSRGQTACSSHCGNPVGNDTNTWLSKHAILILGNICRLCFHSRPCCFYSTLHPGNCFRAEPRNRALLPFHSCRYHRCSAGPQWWAIGWWLVSAISLGTLWSSLSCLPSVSEGNSYKILQDLVKFSFIEMVLCFSLNKSPKSSFWELKPQCHHAGRQGLWRVFSSQGG